MLAILTGIIVGYVWYCFSQVERGAIRGETYDKVMSILIGVCAFLVTASLFALDK